MEPKPYKYYAIRVGNTIMIRRTLIGLKQVTSMLMKPGTQFVLKQVTYTGGIVIGSLSYRDWIRLGQSELRSYKKLDKTMVRSLRPYIVGERHGG
jgi:hypothetical protein